MHLFVEYSLRACGQTLASPETQGHEDLQELQGTCSLGSVTRGVVLSGMFRHG